MPSLPSISTFVLSFLAARTVLGADVISGYWPAWAEADMTIAEIPFDLLTHVDFFVAATTPTFALDLVGPSGVPLSTIEQYIRDMVQRGHSAGSTVGLSLGGGSGSVWFSALAATPENRTQYAQSIVDTLDKYSFDGLDFDWEFPNEGRTVTLPDGTTVEQTFSPEDVNNFAALIDEVRRLAPDARLTMTINAWGFLDANGDRNPPLGPFDKSLDYLTVMLYDLFSSYGGETTGPNAPLACANGAIQPTIQKYIQAGFAADGIVLAVPGYGQMFVTQSSELVTTVVDGHETQMFQPQVNGPPPQEAPHYSQLIDNGWLSADGKTGAGGYTRHWDECSGTPFLFNPEKKSFISYDDPESMTVKAQWAKDNGLAGVEIFALSHDTANHDLIKALSAVIPKQ